MLLCGGEKKKRRRKYFFFFIISTINNNAIFLYYYFIIYWKLFRRSFDNKIKIEYDDDEVSKNKSLMFIHYLHGV